MNERQASIAHARASADAVAREHVELSRKMILRSVPPTLGQLQAATVKPNFAFFRRMAGLSRSDCQEAA